LLAVWLLRLHGWLTVRLLRLHRTLAVWLLWLHGWLTVWLLRLHRALTVWLLRLLTISLLLWLVVWPLRFSGLLCRRCL
jgi:hypothetical protein